MSVETPKQRYTDSMDGRYARLRRGRLRGGLRRLIPRSTWLRDLLAISLTVVALYAVLRTQDWPGRWAAHLSMGSGKVLAHEMLAGVLVMFGLLLFALRRWQVLTQEVAGWRRAHEKARRLATRDALTNLPNRRRLMAELSLAFARVRRGGGAMGLILVNIDHFNGINQVHGHRVGDVLLQEVAQRLQRSLRDTDVVARLSGDEFAILAELRQPVDAAILADRISVELALPFFPQRGKVQLTGRLGIALAPDDADTPDLLLQRAGLALQRAREAGGGCSRFFEVNMDERVKRREQLREALGSAVAEGRIGLHFQPILDLRTRKICGLEALARWADTPYRQISPAEFIPLAEDSGLIEKLTDHLIRQACEAAQAWPSELAVSVNLSPRLLRDTGFPDRVKAILDQTGIPAHRLELEMTEAALTGKLTTVRRVAGDLHAMGVRLSLDDFGSGYGSLRYLHAIPFDRIKIDAGFVRLLGEYSESAKMIETVINLGRSLNIPTVAEGIETEAEAEALLKMGCAMGQGYWFGRPMSAESVNAIFKGVRMALF